MGVGFHCLLREDQVEGPGDLVEEGEAIPGVFVVVDILAAEVPGEVVDVVVAVVLLFDEAHISSPKV